MKKKRKKKKRDPNASELSPQDVLSRDGGWHRATAAATGAPPITATYRALAVVKTTTAVATAAAALSSVLFIVAMSRANRCKEAAEEEQIARERLKMQVDTICRSYYRLDES